MSIPILVIQMPDGGAHQRPGGRDPRCPTRRNVVALGYGLGPTRARKQFDPEATCSTETGPGDQLPYGISGLRHSTPEQMRVKLE